MTRLLALAIVIGGLYWAQAVVVPITLAIFLTCLLSPIVTRLRRWHMGNTFAVVFVVLVTGLIFGSLGWLVKGEVTRLALELPTYTENIQDKVKSLRKIGEGEGMKRLEKMSEDISGEWQKVDPETDEETAEGKSDTLPQSAKEDIPAEDVATPSATPAVPPDIPPWLSRVLSIFRALLSSLGGLALALVLVVFMLLERETLRDRAIRLLGRSRMNATTKVLDDAGERITGYLMMQLAGNVTYGLAWGCALQLIGVDYAILWGVLAAIMRYLPFVGAPLAALMPIALSLAQFPGWTVPLTVVGVFLVLELIWNNVVETLLYGHTIGVSPVAMLVSAAFWAFMWGPVGVLLSGPMTVCLVVIGNHVRELEFLVVLLGDVATLSPKAYFYQRLMARDSDEASLLVLKGIKSDSPTAVYDDLLVPALVRAKQDRVARDLTPDDEEFIRQAIREIMDDLGEERNFLQLGVPDEESPTEPSDMKPMRFVLLACPAKDINDKLALEMLQQLLNPEQWNMEFRTSDTLATNLDAMVEQDEVAAVCIGALPPGGLAYARYLCKKVRTQYPDVKIIVGRWGLRHDVDSNRERLQEVGADSISSTLLETRDQLIAWRTSL